MTSSIAMPISPGSGAEPLAQSMNIPMRTEARIGIPAPPTPTQHTHKETIQLPTLSLSSTMIKRASCLYVVCVKLPTARLVQI